MDNDEKVKPVQLDTILSGELGQFGKFQIRLLGFLLILAIFNASHGEYVFTAKRINTRCLIPECDSNDPEFAPEWLLNAVPGTSLASFDNCQRYANLTKLSSANDTCSPILFDTSVLVSCDQYVYESKDSVVYDFDLACSEWRRTFIGFMRTIGTLTVLPITGYVSDRWGRRTAITLNAFNTAWIAFARSWSGNYSTFVALEFLEATFGSGLFSTVYIYMVEMVNPKHRVIIGATLSTFYAIGEMILGLVAWAVPHWSTFTLVIYTPQLLTIFYIWLIPESMRWYMSKGYYEKSEAVLKKLARTNGKELKPKTLEGLRQSAECDKKRKVEEKELKANEPWLIVLVFRNKPILLRCVVSPVWWITMTFVYYGLSINAVNISGNSYVNYIAASVIEIPGYWLAMLALNRVGRKPLLIIAFWLCGACQITYIFLPNGLYAASLTVYLIGKCAISAVVSSLYIYTTELYPTQYRHNLFAFSSMIGRVGSIAAPLTPAVSIAIWEFFPFAVFAGLALLSGLLVMLVPETLGTKLPDTMDEACHLRKIKDDSY